MGYKLILTEKPSAAKKIAESLADKTPHKGAEKGVTYFTLEHNGKEIVVVPAVGHLYGLKTTKSGMGYPVFDIEWVPSSEIRKDADYTKKYLELIIKLAKKADEFYLATDYDIEGETLGYNILRFACKTDKAKRMKFSTLTQNELVKSFEHPMPHIDFGQANAGVTRHMLDWYYGINLSRALTMAIKKAGRFKILSSGRVQGPALKIIVDKEREINAFKPVPYWEVSIHTQSKNKSVIEAWHTHGEFWDKKEAETVFSRIKDAKTGVVEKIESKQSDQSPPTPFDLTTLQTEAHGVLGISPKNTLATAQNLYLKGLISYPRTSSQQLPDSIGFCDILNKLSHQKSYSSGALKLLDKKALQPNNGKKTDPAHPAIFPTGIIPRSLEGNDGRVYDLIVKRFMATFGEPAVRETQTITFNANTELFVAKGTRTVKKGWHELYTPYVRLEEEELPPFAERENALITQRDMYDKQTAPPRRYTESSIIRELEKRNLGTKSTRAQIIDTLVQRNYVTGSPLSATDFGIHTVEVLEKHCPTILDEELTRSFEDEMESIREEKSKPDSILEKARGILVKISKDFKLHEKEIGEGLLETFKETKENLDTLSPCPVCKDGTLQIKFGKFGRFAACNKYPDCKTTVKLPKSGMIKPTDKNCEHCGKQLMLSIRRAKKPQFICLNSACPSKNISSPLEGTKCPKCETGKIVKRTSVYGSFLACDKFPKCHYTQTLAMDGSVVEKKFVKKEGEVKTEGEPVSSDGEKVKGRVVKKKVAKKVRITIKKSK